MYIIYVNHDSIIKQICQLRDKAFLINETLTCMVRYFANKKQKQNGKQRIDLFAQSNGCSSYYYRLFELKWNEINQESITRRNEQNLYHGVFTNNFSVARICPTTQSAKPTGRLRMIFWPFKDVSIFLFGILFFECACLDGAEFSFSRDKALN